MKNPLKIIQKNISVEEIAKQYLLHEFSKMLSDNNDAKFWQQFEKSLNLNLQKMPQRNFWQLLSGISEGYKLKWLFRILSDNSFSWNREIWNLNDITMTGIDPKIDKIIKEKNSSSPLKFGKYVQKNPNVKKLFFDLEGKNGFYRNKFPILLRQDGEQFKILDGMRRTCLAAIKGQDEIEVIVGYKVRNGKMKLNPDKIYFLDLLYRESKDRERIKEPLKVILKEIKKQFRDVELTKGSGVSKDIKELF